MRKRVKDVLDDPGIDAEGRGKKAGIPGIFTRRNYFIDSVVFCGRLPINRYKSKEIEKRSV